jgi:hypothetical protein
MSHRFIKLPGKKQPVKVVQITPAYLAAYGALVSEKPKKVAKAPAPT